MILPPLLEFLLIFSFHHIPARNSFEVASCCQLFISLHLPSNLKYPRDVFERSIQHLSKTNSKKQLSKVPYFALHRDKSVPLTLCHKLIKDFYSLHPKD
jgi:hypothetical protein